MKIEEIRERILPAIKENHIERAGVFGSAVRGDFTTNSDIDILIKLGRDISLLEFVKIKHTFEDLLGKKVDLVEYQALKPRLRNKILAEEVRIYG